MNLSLGFFLRDLYQKNKVQLMPIFMPWIMLTQIRIDSRANISIFLDRIYRFDWSIQYICHLSTITGIVPKSRAMFT